MPEYNAKLIPASRGLRKRMTPEERHLWYDFLRRLPVTVRRQHVIDEYIVDFYIAKASLILEVDGRFHAGIYHKADDEKRDADLTAKGFTVVRYRNEEIQTNFRAVCEDILRRTQITAADLKTRQLCPFCTEKQE